MLKVQEIRELIRLVDESTIEEFTFEHEGSKIRMKKKGAIVTKQIMSAPQEYVRAVQVEQQESVVSQPVRQTEKVSADSLNDVHKESKSETNELLHKITSPMVGTFYASPSPDAGPYVSVGDKVKKDSIVCIVEAMKLFNEIEAEVNGEVVEILVQSGQLVEYGQPLFLVKAD